MLDGKADREIPVLGAQTKTVKPSGQYWRCFLLRKNLLFRYFSLCGAFERKHDLTQGLEVVYHVNGLQVQRAEYPGQGFRTDVLHSRIQSAKSPFGSLHVRQQLLP